MGIRSYLTSDVVEADKMSGLGGEGETWVVVADMVRGRDGSKKATVKKGGKKTDYDYVHLGQDGQAEVSLRNPLYLSWRSYFLSRVFTCPPCLSPPLFTGPTTANLFQLILRSKFVYTVLLA